MLDQILVPLDRSSLAECVLPHAKAVAQAFGSQVTFLHVVEQKETAVPRRIDPLNWYLRKAEAQTYLDQVSQQWPDMKFSKSVVLEGPAAERIIEFAQSQSVDLLILSSHGRSGLSGWNVSSVVQKIVARVFKSVMLIRAQAEGNQKGEVKYGRILVPLDGSPRAEYILPMAVRLAQQHQAELLFAHVAAKPVLLRGQPLNSEDQELLEHLTERNLSEAARYFEQLQSHIPAPAETRVLVSESVPMTLHQLVEQEKVDLVLLSAHGYICERERPYGTIATNFINYGTTPLLIIQDLGQPEQKMPPLDTMTKAPGNGEHLAIYAHSSS